MTATAVLASPGPFAVFRKRNFTMLWTGQLVSTAGSALTSLAASILIYRVTGSALSVGLMLMATALPSLLLGLVAGVFVDRYDRRRIMIAADVIRAAVVFLIPVLVPMNIAWLYVLVMMSSAVTTFFDPAHATVLPEVATDEELGAANSLMAISSFGSTAIGFAGAGLLAGIDIRLAFWVDAASFLFSAACIAFIRLPRFSVEGETNVASVFRNMRSGLDFLWRSPVLRSLYFIVPITGFAFGMWNTLLLPFATKALGATEFQYGIQEGVTSLGFVAGSLFMARAAGRLPEGLWMALGYLTMGIAGIVYAASSNIPVAIVLVTISGFANAPAAVARSLLVQRNTTREVRGRVNSAFFVWRDVAFLVGMGAAGLADTLGVRQMVFVSSLITVGAGIAALVLPGLGRPAAELRHMLAMLRVSQAAAKPALGRAATLADFDALAARLPVLSGLNASERRRLISASKVIQAAAGSPVVRKGEASDAVYFILAGTAVAGLQMENGDYRVLETLRAGDFFGEIAALTGSVRTADVVAAEPSDLVQVPAPAFRQVLSDAQLSRLVHVKFAERMGRMNITDLPRFAGYDQRDLRELRTEPAAA